MTNKKLLFIIVITLAVVIMGIYGTYALDTLVSEGTSTEYDFDI